MSSDSLRVVLSEARPINGERGALAFVERIERALRAAPDDVSLQINLAGARKLARRFARERESQ